MIYALLFFEKFEHNFQQFRRSFSPGDCVEIGIFMDFRPLCNLLSVAPVIKSLPLRQRFVWNFHVSILVKKNVCEGIDRPGDCRRSDQHKQNPGYCDQVVFLDLHFSSFE